MTTTKIKVQLHNIRVKRQTEGIPKVSCAILREQWLRQSKAILKPQVYSKRDGFAKEK